MPQGVKLKPILGLAFRMMVWVIKLEDLFKSPQVLLQKAPIKEGMTVIDYACGPNRYAIPAAERVGSKGIVQAVDTQPLAIEIVKRKAASKSLENVHTVLVDSFDTGIPDSSADIVLLIDALYPIKNREALLHEIHRLLKPDGFLLMDSSHMSVAKAKSIVEGTGLFDLVNLEGHNMLWAKKKR